MIKRFHAPMTSAHPLPPADVQATDARASVLMKQGIRLLNEVGPAAAAEALGCFDGALELRRTLPIETFPTLRYGLAACWLNRADALMHLGSPAQMNEALASFDAAIALLRELPLGDDPQFSKRLAIAYQNRGLALQFVGHPAAESIAAFEQAIAVLDDQQATEVPDRSYLLAAIWVNLAAAHLSVGDGTPARDAAVRAMQLVAPLQDTDADAAEVAIKARYVVCRIIASRLSQPAPGDILTRDIVDEATDAVDDGLAIARGWERHGIGRFRDLAYDMFRFGARVYAAFQPHFVAEFVLDNTDPEQSSPGYADSEEMRAAAAEALALVAGRDTEQSSAAG
jgi:hypothetical protein